MEKPFSEEISRRYLRELDAANVPYITCNAREKGYPIMSCSPGFTALTGYTEGEVKGKNPRILQGALTSHDARDQIKQVLNSATDGHVLIQNFKRNESGVKGSMGSSFWNMLYLAPIKNKTGKVHQWIGVLADATEVRQYYEQKPAVQLVINVCKSLMAQMQTALSVLGPVHGSRFIITIYGRITLDSTPYQVYGSREWSSNVDEKALKTQILHEAGGTFKYGGRTGPTLSASDEYMGEIMQGQAFGNVVVETECDEAFARGYVYL